ncbi:MAG: zeta-carotene desaturase, partial [Synechococcus sp.]|nr:zeta-carotene desaturase [Synechococcus sp.]
MPELSKVTNSDSSHVVVVGAGWAGWGAAKALCEAGVRVTLIDALADPTGRTPMRT